MDCQTIGVIANGTKASVSEMLPSVLAHLRELGREILCDRATASLAGEHSDLSIKGVFRRSSLLVILGGDGTLLHAVHEGSFPAPPMLGVNMGTLGFLTGAGGANFGAVLEEVFAGKAILSERSLLSVEVIRDGNRFWNGRALNEVVVSRGERSRVIRLEVEIDEVALTEYNAEG